MDWRNVAPGGEKNMGNLKKRIIAVLICVFPAGGLFADLPVFDPTNWLSAVDQLYKTYDMVMNQITMIEQNYQQIQHAYEQAKSWKFNEIKWDGDLDFRNEIMNATSQVNKQLNHIRKIRDTFNKKNLVVNGTSYSLADLAGFGGSGKSMADYISDAMDEAKKNAERAKNSLAYGLTDRQAQFLWSKYGLSPANYKMVHDAKNKLKDAAAVVLGEAETENEEIKKEEQERLQTVDNIMAQLGQEAELTDKELSQAQAFLLANLTKGIEDLKGRIVNAAAYTAWKDRIDAQEAEARRMQQNEDMSNLVEKHRIEPVF